MALPSVVPLAPQPAGLSQHGFDTLLSALLEARIGDADFLVRGVGEDFRASLLEGADGKSLAVVLPFDQLFEHRASSALRLWRAVTGRAPGPDMATLPPARRDRLLMALRALDGRLEEAAPGRATQNSAAA